MHEFVILADDFTGANDTGVQVAKRGLPVSVILRAEDIRPGSESMVIDSESRVISETDAYNRVYAMASAVEQTGDCRFLYKKVDSTLRGNITAEIKAVIAACHPDIIIFAPSLPAQGRTVQNGRLYVHGVPLMETEIARDPRNPLKTDQLSDLLAPCLDSPVHTEIPESGWECGGYIFDAATDDDLYAIARQGMAQKQKILWIGSAGLANALLQICYAPSPALAVVGSVSTRTMEQMAYCRSHGGIIHQLPMEQLYEGASLVPYLDAVRASLSGGKDVLITAAATRKEYETFLDYGKKRGLSSDELAGFTKHILSQTATAIVTHYALCGLFLTGGDTAIAVVEQLQARGFQIEREILPGFVQGRLLEGLCPQLPVVTKAGAFGKAPDIWNALQCLKKIPRQA